MNTLNAVGEAILYANPIRQGPAQQSPNLSYDSVTGEITYDTTAVPGAGLPQGQVAWGTGLSTPLEGNSTFLYTAPTNVGDDDGLLQFDGRIVLQD